MDAGAGMSGQLAPGPTNHEVTRSPYTQELAPGVYAYIQPDGGWYVNNSGIITSKSAVIVIDAAATEQRTNQLRSAIAELSDQPVTTVINSHWHTDHTNGNYQFRGATIVAQERTREQMTRFAPTVPDPSGPFPDVEWGNLQLALPFLTFQNNVTVWADDLKCEVRWVGKVAHTTDDTIVWIPEHSILFTGDLAFNGGTPLVSAGSVAGSLEVFAELKALAPKVVVPGHGDVCGPEIFDLQIDYLHFVQELAADGHRDGRSPLDVARAAAGHRFEYLLDAERLVANLHRAYAELDGAERGADIDLVATRRDMISLYGGPLRCTA